jgi:hypothetical protein
LQGAGFGVMSAGYSSGLCRTNGCEEDPTYDDTRSGGSTS